MSIRLAAAAVLFTLPLSSCVAAAIGTVGAVGYAAAKDKSIGEAVDDTTASTEIKGKLLRNSNGRFDSVDVEVTNGLALLTGSVYQPEDRIAAEDIAWSSSRVIDVANELQVSAPGGWGSTLSDKLITTRVNAALLAAKSVKGINYNVETYDGTVYLMGIAQDEAELQKAAEKVSYVGGVKEVISYVRIRDTTQMRAGRPVAPVTQNGQAPYQSGSETAYRSQQQAEDELLGGSPY